MNKLTRICCILGMATGMYQAARAQDVDLLKLAGDDGPKKEIVKNAFNQPVSSTAIRWNFFPRAPWISGYCIVSVK